MKRNQHNHDAQSTIEFLFTVVLIALIMFALIKAFGWVGLDLAERRIAHDRMFADLNAVNESWDTLANQAYRGPLNQIRDNFYNIIPMDLSYNAW